MQFGDDAMELGVGRQLARSRSAEGDSNLVDDPPGLRRHDDDSIGQRHRFGHLMRHEQDRRTTSLERRDQAIAEFLAKHVVERSERLVHEQKFRVGHPGSGERDSHSHAARKLPRELRRVARAKADLFQQIAQTLRIDRATGELFGQANVAGDRSPRKQGRVLKDERAAAATAVRLGGRFGVGTPDLNAPRSRAIESGDQSQHRRLAATARSQQSDELARRDVEIDPLENGLVPEPTTARDEPNARPSQDDCPPMLDESLRFGRESVVRDRPVTETPYRKGLRRFRGGSRWGKEG